MKKDTVLISFIIGVIVAFLVLFAIGRTEERHEDIPEFRDDLVILMEDLSLEYWESENQTGTIVSDGDIIIYEPGEIMLAIGDEDVYFTLVIDFSESDNPAGSLVWNVMLLYVNYEDDQRLFVDFYHYDEWWIEDFADESFGYTEKKVLEILEDFTIEDLEYILNELGYGDYL